MHEFRIIRCLTLLAPVLLLGCAGPAPVVAPAPQRECAAQAARALVGQPFDSALQAEAQRLSGARALRVIRPGQAVTMDFNAYRLNIELDAADRVMRLHCG